MRRMRAALAVWALLASAARLAGAQGCARRGLP